MKKRVVVSAALALMLAAIPVLAVSPNIVISQVYGGGGNSGAPYTNDFIELFNRGTTAASLSGMTLQYASAAGTGNFGASTTQITDLPAVSLQPGQYYLVQEAGGATGAALPTPDTTDATPIAMSATAGKVALVNSTVTLGCNGGSTPCSAAQLALIIDLVGYGTANFFEGAVAPAPSNTTSLFRAAGGCADTDTNSTDFSAAAPGPRNTSTTFAPCSGPVTVNLSINDVSLAEGDAGTTNFMFTVSLSSPAPVGGVTFDIATADGTAQDDTPATEDNDYVAQSVTGQTIAVGVSAGTFTVVVNGDTVTESNETFFVNVSGVVGATVTDSQGLGTINNDDVTLTPIHDIQGPGASSPIVGSSVSTRGIVTGLKSNGFFIQEPDGSVDADPATSEGIFVFTSSAPPAAAVVANLVQVTGTISEYVPSADPLQPPLTELTSPTVLQISTGNPLPTAVPLTATFPDPAGPFDQLERLEGMRVSVASLTVTGATLGNVNENAATATSTGVFFGVVTGIARPLREPGIQWADPGPDGSIPRWDTNPELLRVDSDGLFASPPVTPIDVGTGAVVTDLVGPLDYSYRRYTILPEPTSVPGVSGGPTLTAAPAPTVDELTVAAFNFQRLYDTVNDPGSSDVVVTATALSNRLAKISQAMRDFLRLPDIVGAIEVENLTTLQAVAARTNADEFAASGIDPLYQAYLVEGNDVGGIDVGFLVKTANAGANPRVVVDTVVQENAGELFTNLDASTELLNDRPPLVLEATVNFADGRTYPITVIVVHQRSLNDVDSTAAGDDGWATKGERVRAKRQKQAESLANLVQSHQADPAERVVVLGDFNAFEVNDGYVDVMGVDIGAPVPDNQTVVPGDGIDLINPNLTNLVSTVASLERYSYVYDGNAQNLDHALVNGAVLVTAVARLEHPRIDADFAETVRNDTTSAARISDHDPLIVYLALDGDGDGIADSVDPCDDTISPQFTFGSQVGPELSGTVFDCSGVADIVLAPGAVNLYLVVGGNPGDTTRSWTVRLAQLYLPGSGTLIATDGSTAARETQQAIALQELEPIPVLGGSGLALLAFLLAVAGAAAIGRRTLLG